MFGSGGCKKQTQLEDIYLYLDFSIKVKHEDLFVCCMSKNIQLSPTEDEPIKDQ